MGKKSSSSSNKPWKKAQPYLLGAADTLGDTYSQNAGNIQGVADQFTGLVPSLLEQYQQGDATVNAAQDYNTSVLNGDYLGANPYLDQMLAASNSDIVNSSQASLGLKGLTGGSSYADIISNNVAQNTLNTRYADYNNERSRMSTAASQAGQLAAADQIPLQSALSAGSMATLPTSAAGQYASSLGGLLGGYQQQTTPGGWGNDLLSAGTAIGSAFLMSDARLKTDVRRVGQTDEGLTVYTYRYGGAGPYHMGVIAQEIEQAQPNALGPVVSGYKSVNYAEVR